MSVFKPGFVITANSEPGERKYNVHKTLYAPNPRPHQSVLAAQAMALYVFPILLPVMQTLPTWQHDDMRAPKVSPQR